MKVTVKRQRNGVVYATMSCTVNSNEELQSFLALCDYSAGKVVDFDFVAGELSYVIDTTC